MIVKTFVVGSLSTNCYLVTCEETGRSVVIDPGGITHALLDSVQKAKVERIVLTHGHFDHMAGAGKIMDITGAPMIIHSHDAGLLNDPLMNGSFMMGQEIIAPPASSVFGDGDTITVGESRLRAVHTPGHTQGGTTLVGDTFVLSGDTLFRMSVGRWDLPGGNYDILMSSLRKYFELDNDMILYPGHGDPSTIGFERQYNEFLLDL